MENKKIVQRNDLITSIAKMDKVPLKFFELVIAQINVNNPPKDNIILLSKNELFSYFDANDTNKHNRFKNAIDKMQKQAFFSIRYNEENKGTIFENIVPITTVKWNDYNDDVFIRLNPDIMPYLIDLKSNFTQYELSEIMSLNSKYSIILYKYLIMNFNIGEKYKYKVKNTTKKCVDSYMNPTITVDEFRMLTDTVNDYDMFYNLEQRVIKSAVDEINENTTLNVLYKKIKKGRKITAIQFFLSKKQVAPIDYKIFDSDYLEEKQKRTMSIGEILESEFTKILVKNELLSSLDLIDTELMYSLDKHVYTYYKELEHLRGMHGVISHVEYVRDNMLPYTQQKKNIVKYLSESIKKYLPRVKIEDVEHRIQEQNFDNFLDSLNTKT